MTSSNSNKHFTTAERIVIENGIHNGSTKAAIALVLGKDKSTAGKEIKRIGNIIKPLIEQGQSIYAILSSHPEITLSEHTIYNYIDRGVFQDVGISIKNIDLPRKAGRKITKRDSVKYKIRKDYSYLKGRTKKEYDEYTSMNPNAHIVQMDTVYDDISNGPFMQTFKFLKYDLLLIVYLDKKDSADMLDGILLLEEIMGRDLFEKEVEVLVTDRGSEFVLASEAETRDDGTIRTRVFYCDPMCSWQKGSLENIHELIRRICPHNCDLRALGLTDQNKANLISSHINSYPKEKLDGKTSFQLVQFYNPDFFEKLKGFDITEILADEVLLKPFLLKE